MVDACLPFFSFSSSSLSFPSLFKEEKTGMEGRKRKVDPLCRRHQKNDIVGRREDKYEIWEIRILGVFYFIEQVSISLNTFLEKKVLKYEVTTVRPYLTHTVRFRS